MQPVPKEGKLFWRTHSQSEQPRLTVTRTSLLISFEFLLPHVFSFFFLFFLHNDDYMPSNCSFTYFATSQLKCFLQTERSHSNDFPHELGSRQFGVSQSPPNSSANNCNRMVSSARSNPHTNDKTTWNHVTSRPIITDCQQQSVGRFHNPFNLKSYQIWTEVQNTNLKIHKFWSKAIGSDNSPPDTPFHKRHVNFRPNS
jgi:hypothetical protein